MPTTMAERLVHNDRNRPVIKLQKNTHEIICKQLTELSNKELVFQIFFRDDGYLYLFFGDGGSGGDPRGYAQNKYDRSFFHPYDTAHVTVCTGKAHIVLNAVLTNYCVAGRACWVRSSALT